MKIVLFLDNPFNQTGFASTCRLTGAEFMARGHEVYAMAFNGGPQPDPVADWYGIKVIPNYAAQADPSNLYGDAETVLRVQREIDPDIFFFHNDSYRYSYIPLLPDSIKEKSVFWLPFEGTDKDFGGIETFKSVAAVRFVTEHGFNLHKEELAGYNIGVIPHAVNISDFSPPLDKAQAKEESPLGLKNKFVVSRVDRHQPRKFWDRAVKAFAKFAKGKDDVFFLAKCDPRDISMYDSNTQVGMDLQKLAKELGVEGKIHFDDFFFNTSALVKSFHHPADVMLTTTSGEGFGLGVAEAMACELPVICPNVPVLPEVVGSGGLFCAVEKQEYSSMNVMFNLVDIDDVVSKLEEAYKHWKAKDGILEALGSVARAHVKANYESKHVYDEWDETLKDILRKKDIVSIITVLYNMTGDEQIYGPDGIDKLRASLENFVDHPYEWVIVDNGSPAKDETAVWLKKTADEDDRVKPIYSEINLGFAGACNLGIAKSIGKQVILVNPDSEALDHKKMGLGKDFVASMVDKAKSSRDIGIVGMELNRRDDIMPGLIFPYFCNVLITRECLKKCRFDTSFWPGYYEDADFTIQAMSKGFKVVSKNVAFWHKSGGTNKFALSKADILAKSLADLEASTPDGFQIDFPRKKAEIAASGMQGLIDGNIRYLNSKYGPDRNAGIKIVWHTHVGAAVGFSQIAEGLVPELHRLGFDVYVNDWSNGANVEDPVIMQLIEKTRLAKENGIDLEGAINIVCWLMESFLDVDADFKVGVSFCESTKVRPQYLSACNSMDSILTFSNFCKKVQQISGFTANINVIPPGVNQKFIGFHQRVQTDQKFTFLSVGVAQERKDTRRMVDAFCEAFPKDAAHPPECESSFPVKCSNIELVLKSNVFGDLGWVHDEGFSARANIKTIFTGNDPRAEKADMSTQEMYDLYCSADCLLHPSHGEGIGLPILEAAATGLPVIFTDWSSPPEYLNESNAYPVCLSPYPNTTFTEAYPGQGTPGENGVWANSHIGHLKHQMYHVVRNRTEAAQKGKLASEHVRKNFNWKESAYHLMPLIFEWDEERKNKKSRDSFDPASFKKPTLPPIAKGDRVMIDIVTRDRHSYLCSLLVSLLGQTFKDWDVIIQCDDADDMMPNDYQIMSLMSRLSHEGHSWRIIRSHRQGPHLAHDRTLSIVKDDPNYKYKLICRIDDDIYVQPDFLEKLYQEFLKDEKAEIGAVSGVYLDPRRGEQEQCAPTNFENDINYAGKIDHNVPWPYICTYPAGTKPRDVEHLYSSFMYRVEAAVAIGGYCRLYSQIGHREESDFSHRFFLGGWKLLVHPSAVGFHFSAPGGGIRSDQIINRESLAESDNKIYLRRLAKWKQSKHQPKETALPILPFENKKMIVVINAGHDSTVAKHAVAAYCNFSSDIYMTTTSQVVKDAVSPFVKMVAMTPDETAILARILVSEGNHEFILTANDTMRFEKNPTGLLSEKYDNYVFEVYRTYTSMRTKRSASGALTYQQEGGDRVWAGPELKNSCLITRRNASNSVQRTNYCDIRVFDDVALLPINGKSVHGNDLIRMADMDKTRWTKLCTYQFPEGELNPPKKAEFVPISRPKVSIIIPTPGRKDMLIKCINSIFSFTTTPFEIVIVDNGSRDGTAEWLANEVKVRPNIKHLRQSKNLGYQKAINIGVAASVGEYVLLFNDDAWVDASEPDGRDWLQHYIDALADKKVGIVGPHGIKSPALGEDMLMFWCVMMRREVMDAVGPLDDITFVNYGGDDDYCARLKAKGYTVKTLYTHLRHLMTVVPDEVKRPELVLSEKKLKQKYGKT